MSGVTGAAEVVADLRKVAAAVDGLGGTLADVARDRAMALAPTRAQLVAVVNPAGAVLNYSGVINADAFETHIATDLDTLAADAVEDEINTAIERAGLT